MVILWLLLFYFFLINFFLFFFYLFSSKLSGREESLDEDPRCQYVLLTKVLFQHANQDMTTPETSDRVALASNARSMGEQWYVWKRERR